MPIRAGSGTVRSLCPALLALTKVYKYLRYITLLPLPSPFFARTSSSPVTTALTWSTVITACAARTWHAISDECAQRGGQHGGGMVGGRQRGSMAAPLVQCTLTA